MFSYCGNNPTTRKDSEGSRFHNSTAMVSLAADGGSMYDYVIHYFHPDSTMNLDGPAMQNHSFEDSVFIGVGSFDELSNVLNNTSWFVDDIFMYLHGDDTSLSFYYALYYTAEDIEANLGAIPVYGNIYLFSCKGGRGELASTLASTTNSTVIASEYKVSFGNGYARCGWKNYLEDRVSYGKYSWYSFSPSGCKNPYSYFWVNTR